MFPLQSSLFRSRALIFGAALVLSGCESAPLVPESPLRADFSTGVVDLKGRPGPPKGPEGACWQDEIRPAVIISVTQQVLVSPEKRDGAGNVTPAVYASETKQEMEVERGTIWFRAPCPEVLDEEFIATLQRALKARGLYLAPLTGKLDKKTRDALHRYQRDHGLDSDKLSLAAARELGLLARDL